ncbi:MAG: hypothetical protein HKN87_19965 [Saprospiraceae bacterium]|nr:hypothetical protein [Saprospiraceae bacterium]
MLILFMWIVDALIHMVHDVEKLIGRYVAIALLFGILLIFSCTRKANKLIHTLVMGQILSQEGKPVSEATIQIYQAIFRPDLTDNNEGFSKVESEDARATSDEQGNFMLVMATESGLKEIQIGKGGQLFICGHYINEWHGYP